MCFLLSIGVAAFAQRAGRHILVSRFTGDTYTVVTRFPAGFDSSLAYPVVIFPDASLKSGRYILGLDTALSGDCVMIGIAHTGNHVMRRQRDFIPSDAGGYCNDQFGQAGKFYMLVKHELIPLADRLVPHRRGRVFIGHSFGGLLALYMSLIDNQLFDQYFAISPSVWANNYELTKIEALYSGKTRDYRSTIHLYAGGLEIFNKVYASTVNYGIQLRKRHYTDFKLSFEEVEWANHYSIVARVIPGIFQSLRHDR